MGLILVKRNKQAKNSHLHWKCSSCTKSKTAYDESFFSLLKKSPRIIKGLIKCWSGQLTVSKSISMIQLNLEEKICSDVVSSLFYRLRQMASLRIDKANFRLGGVRKIVEIDESMYARVKFNKGNDLKRAQVWVFGLVERNEPDSRCSMVIVFNRESLSLLNIIYNTCEIGTLIYSDCWKAYNKISSFKDYKHQTVNHSYNFIDPDSESLSRCCKQRFKDMNGCTKR